MSQPPVLIVTGGSRGIGAATAALAASKGYTVCISYLQGRDCAEEVVRGITGNGGRAIAIQADMGVAADVMALFRHAASEPGPITAPLNHAASLEPQTRLERMTAARMQRMFAVN